MTLGLMLLLILLSPLMLAAIGYPGIVCCCDTKFCGCEECNSGTSPQWLDITVSGITNGTCSNCDDFNGEFRLLPCSSCHWTLTIDDIGCYGSITYIAIYQGGRLDVYLYQTSNITDRCDGTGPDAFRKISWGASLTADCDTWEDELLSLDTDYMEGDPCFGGAMGSPTSYCTVTSGPPCDSESMMMARSSMVSVSREDRAIALLSEEDQPLLGDRAEQLFAALGFPPCAACKGRKEWLNNAHLWVRSLFE